MGRGPLSRCPCHSAWRHCQHQLGWDPTAQACQCVNRIEIMPVSPKTLGSTRLSWLKRSNHSITSYSLFPLHIVACIRRKKDDSCLIILQFVMWYLLGSFAESQTPILITSNGLWEVVPLMSLISFIFVATYQFVSPFGSGIYGKILFGENWNN